MQDLSLFFGILYSFLNLRISKKCSTVAADLKKKYDSLARKVKQSF